MGKNPKIEGIVFRYGDDDYSFWMPDISIKENVNSCKRCLRLLRIMAVRCAAQRRTSSIPSEKTPETIGANLKKMYVLDTSALLSSSYSSEKQR